MIGAVWSLQWYTPYEEPPPGWPRVRAEGYFPVGHQYVRQCPPELKLCKKPGDGWRICWRPVEKPLKPLQQDALASVRVKRLKRRTEAKYPLFADQIVAEELAKKPA